MTASEQRSQQPFFDVENIIRPLSDHGTVESLQHLGVAAQRLARGKLATEVPFANERLDLLAQHGVVEHLQLSRKDGAVMIADLLGNAIAAFLDFRSNRFLSLMPARKLLFRGVALHEAMRDAESLFIQNQCLADRHTGRNRDPLEYSHCPWTVSARTAEFLLSRAVTQSKPRRQPFVGMLLLVGRGALRFRRMPLPVNCICVRVDPASFSDANLLVGYR